MVSKRGHHVGATLVFCDGEVLDAGIGELQASEGDAVGIFREVVEHQVAGGVDELAVGAVGVGVLAEVAGPLVAAFEDDLLEGIGEAGDDHVVAVDMNAVRGLRTGRRRVAPRW